MFKGSYHSRVFKKIHDDNKYDLHIGIKNQTRIQNRTELNQVTSQVAPTHLKIPSFATSLCVKLSLGILYSFYTQTIL